MGAAKGSVGEPLRHVFYDLNLPEAGKDTVSTQDRQSMSLSLGYSGAAITHVAVDRLTEKDRCTSAYLDASDPAISQSVMARAPDGMEGVWPQKAVRQFRRLTFQCSEAGAAAEALQGRGPIPLTYDIVAVQPATERVFQQACSSLHIDVIALDATEPFPFILRTALVKAALKRGIFFELCYSSALLSDAKRRVFFQNAAGICRETRGRGIILSSGARDAFEMRDPHTLVNIACLFGMKEQQAYAALSTNPVAVLQHGLQRRRGRHAFIAVPRPCRVPDDHGMADDSSSEVDLGQNAEVEKHAPGQQRPKESVLRQEVKSRTKKRKER